MSGWIKLHRSVLKHWTHQDPDFFRAWIDLLLMANHEAKKVVLHSGKVLEVQRGQCLTSMLNLAGQWNWDRKTVKRFFCTLQNDQQITQQSTQHYTLITILNYDRFQGSDDDEGTAERTTEGTTDAPTEGTTPPQQTGHDQEDKELKEVKKRRKKDNSPLPFDDFPLEYKTKEVHDEYQTWINVTRKKPVTRRIQQGLFDNFPTATMLAAALRQSNDNGWQGVFPVKNQQPTLKAIPGRKLSTFELNREMLQDVFDEEERERR